MKKITIDDSKKIFLLFLGVSLALILSFSLLISKADSITDKYYESYDLPELTIQNQIINFIKLANTLTIDSFNMNKSIINTYHILTGKSANKYSSYVKNTKLFDNFGEITREVYIDEMPRKISPNTYEVGYKVLTRQYSGLLISNINYKAIINAKVLHPSVSDISDNPLGIYITDFDIQKIKTNEEV